MALASDVAAAVRDPMIRLTVLLAGVATCMIASPGLAQSRRPPPPADDSADDEADIVVTANGKPRGSVIGDIPPEVTLTPGDIRSYGVSSVSDLLAELAPQLNSSQGRGGESPIVLLAGKRISSFSEVRDIPTEAIQRVEILPEEVALKYGYRPDQKVVNIVLKRRFKAITGEIEAAMPTEGGQFSPATDDSYFQVLRDSRLNLALKYQHSSALTENERDIARDPPRQPYAIAGNITSAVTGAEIDPALSGLLGRPATVVGVPASAASAAPSLADFVPGTVNVSDTRRFRTLLPQTDALTMNAVIARTMFGNVSTTFNGTFTYNRSQSMQGLASAQLDLPAGSPFSPFSSNTVLYRYLGEFGALGQDSRDITGHLGATFNGMLGAWQWSLTANADHAVSRTITQRGFDLTGLQDRIDALDPLANPYAPLSIGDTDGRLTDRAHSTSDSGNAKLVFSGPLFALPAGKAVTSLTVGGSLSRFHAQSLRSGVEISASLPRDIFNGQANIDLPIASRKNGVLAGLGELSANFNLGYDNYSDAGGLRSWGAGIVWAPIKPVSFNIAFDKDQGAPTVQQLGNPFVATTGVRVFDYVRGETVEITRLTGGNASLEADDRRLFKIGMTLKPPIAKADLTLTATYTNSRVKNPIASFPTATAAIEAAFPERFTRDPSGRLVSIDSRPINFARQDQQTFRWGINFSKQLSTPPRPAGGWRGRGGADGGGQREGDTPNLRDLLPPGPGGRPNPNQRDAAGSGGPGGGAGPGRGRYGGFGRGGGGRGTRLQLAIYHTVHLKDAILVHDGGPRLDLLNGDAIGAAGGQPRHEIQGQLGLTHNGFGARLNANWQSGTTVTGGSGSTQTLRFSPLTTVDLRVFANLGQQQKLTTKIPFLRGSRITLSVVNLFNQRMRVRDADGVTPVSYQPDYLDPLGRSIKISFRKLFF